MPSLQEYRELIIEEIRKLCPDRSDFPDRFKDDCRYCMKKQYDPRKAADLIAVKYGWVAMPIPKRMGPRNRRF